MALLHVVNPGSMHWQVSWRGVRSPTIHDAVALLVPADADAALTAPVKHRWCTASPSHLTNGSGTLECAHHFLHQMHNTVHAAGGLSVNMNSTAYVNICSWFSSSISVVFACMPMRKGTLLPGACTLALSYRHICNAFHEPLHTL